MHVGCCGKCRRCYLSRELAVRAAPGAFRSRRQARPCLLLNRRTLLFVFLRSRLRRQTAAGFPNAPTTDAARRPAFWPARSPRVCVQPGRRARPAAGPNAARNCRSRTAPRYDARTAPASAASARRRRRSRSGCCDLLNPNPRSTAASPLSSSPFCCHASSWLVLFCITSNAPCSLPLLKQNQPSHPICPLGSPSAPSVRADAVLAGPSTAGVWLSGHQGKGRTPREVRPRLGRIASHNGFRPPPVRDLHSVQIEAVQGHHLGPRSDEVRGELLLSVGGGIDFRNSA